MKRLIDWITDALRERTILLKMLSFGIVGLINVSVDFGVFVICYKMFLLQLVASNALAWIVAVCGSYVLNTMFTFRVESGQRLRIRDFVRFACSGLIGEIVATAVLVFLSLYITVFIAKGVSIIVGFGVNFSMSNFFVFRRRASALPPL
jgi:putative flippase GtrA